MRQVYLFILPILIIVTLAFIVFGVLEVRFEEERLLDDLRRKSKAVTESMEFSVRYVLLNQDLITANYLVEKFEQRERLQGCVIYDREGNIIAFTKRIADWQKKEKPYLREIIANKKARGGIEKFKDYSVYSYILPVLDSQGNLLGLTEVIYDTSYVFKRLTEIWRRISIVLIVLIFSIALLSLLLHRQIFILPIRRLTQWFHYFQRGEIETRHPIKERGELGKLAREAEQVALLLRVARKSISDKAEGKLKEIETWNEAKLKNLIRARLSENAFFVVSNREPFMHILEENTGTIKCVQPASGVVSALHPVLSACGGVWIAHGAGNADRRFVNSKDKLGVPPQDNRYILKRVWLSKEEEEGYYYGFANEGLWPLCHNTHTRPIFREKDWQMYKQVNQKFAQAILEELPKNPFIFIQDYHFCLLPKMLKEARPDAVVALFWHIPWPMPETFLICPYYGEILEGLLGADLLGFHIQSYCNNFLDTANRLLESRVDTERFSVVRFAKETSVRSFPISVDTFIDKNTNTKSEAIERLKREYGLKGKIIGLGVERIDYTKGIAEKFLALDRFLEKFPTYRNRFIFIQLAAPSRTHIKRYHDLASELDELVERINWKYQQENWRPIIYLKRHFSLDEIYPYYALADICIVSSLHDGMNLVAKEYIVAKRDLEGVLILSRFTGASRELTEAVLVNPYAREEFAEKIRFAIEMSPAERRQRLEKMRNYLLENNIYRWAANIINELASLKKI